MAPKSKPHRFKPGSKARIESRSLQQNPKRAGELLGHHASIRRQIKLALKYLLNVKLDNTSNLRVAQDVRVYRQAVSSFLRSVIHVANLFRRARDHERISGQDYLNAIETHSSTFGEPTLQASVLMRIKELKQQNRLYFEAARIQTRKMAPKSRTDLRNSGNHFEHVIAGFGIQYIRKLQKSSGIIHSQPEAPFVLQTIAAAFLVEIVRRSAVYVNFLNTKTLDDRIAIQVLRDSGVAALPSNKLHRVHHRKSKTGAN